jgi:RNA polymerase sigma-70 factor, ECF subfamily
LAARASSLCDEPSRSRVAVPPITRGRRGAIGGDRTVTPGARSNHGRRRSVAPVDDDIELLERLRAGDEQAFVTIVARHHDSMLRLASSFVPSQAVAEEVVQDTWLGVVRGIDRFEGRSTLQTWLLRILVNRARSTGMKERRHAPIADTERAVDASRFNETGQWSVPPTPWADQVDERLAADKLKDAIRTALGHLPALQREVVALRDVDGLSTKEVCEVLDITEGNQRVLLHRGRSRLRQALESEFGRA